MRTGSEPGARAVGFEGAVGEVGRYGQYAGAIVVHFVVLILRTFERRLCEELGPEGDLLLEGTCGMFTTNRDHGHLRPKYKPNFQKSQW